MESKNKKQVKSYCDKRTKQERISDLNYLSRKFDEVFYDYCIYQQSKNKNSNKPPQNN